MQAWREDSGVTRGALRIGRRIPNSVQAPPVRPLVAARAIRALVADPHDTAQVFVIKGALEGPSLARIYPRFAASRVGQRIAADPDASGELLERLCDRDYLRGLPEGSLGRAYLDFLEAAGIEPEGLESASEAGTPIQDEGLRHLRDRMRNAHDLLHVVTGYDTDVVGESAVLSFVFAQTGNAAQGLIVLAAFLQARGRMRHARRTIVRSFLRGRRSAWVLAADWERLLAMPLDEVRRELGLTEVPDYTHVYPDQVPARRHRLRPGPRSPRLRRRK